MPGKVLVTATNYSKYCLPARKMLEQNGFEVTENPHDRPYTTEELKTKVPDIVAAIVGPDRWNEDIFRVAPNLKIITRFGVGTDNIDLEAATRHGIAVTNAKGQNAAAVAEQAIGLMLCLLREIPLLDKKIRTGEWTRTVGRNLGGKTIGLLGFGMIAQKVAEKLAGFSVKIIAFDQYPNRVAADRLGVTFAGLDEVLAQSDLVSLHLPATEETIGIMNHGNFEKMKPGSFFVNTARGALVNDKDLYEALKSGRLAGAGLDVYNTEPTAPDNPLFTLDNVVCTPHTSGDTLDTYHDVSMSTAQAVIDYFNGKKPLNLLNQI